MSTSSRLGTAALVLLLVSVSALTVVATLVAARLWIFPPGIEPVTLDSREQADLDRKIQPLREAAGIPGPAAEPYAERPEDRIVYLTERELNAIIAKSPELADKVFFRLSEDMISASLLITFPEDFPVLAARTVRVGTGLRIGQKDGRPSIVVEGVSLMGVPLPAAWLGGFKGADLADRLGPDSGLKELLGGIKDLRVEQGRLRIEVEE